MAEILITGVEIPKKGNVGIMIYADGSVEVVGTGKLSRPIYGVPTTKAQVLPDHGELKDVDLIKGKVGLLDNFECQELVRVRRILDEAPTVIPASEREQQ